MKLNQKLLTVLTLAAGLPPEAFAAPKILVVVSAATKVALKEGGFHKTGYFLRELTDPVKKMQQAGFELEFATPNAVTPTVDANSLQPMWYAFPNPLTTRARLEEALSIDHNLREQTGRGTLSRPYALEDLDDNNLKKYAALFVPGGHAPMTDLAVSPDMGRVLNHFHRNGKPTALICHGPIALMSARQSDGSWTYEGYRVSIATTAEERLVERLGILDDSGKKRTLRVAYYVDQALEEEGAILERNMIPSGVSVSRDRELITAQNPNSAAKLGKMVVAAVLESL